VPYGPSPLALAPSPRLWDLEPDTGPTGETCDRQATMRVIGHGGAQRSPVSAPVWGTRGLGEFKTRRSNQRNQRLNRKRRRRPGAAGSSLGPTNDGGERWS
jgi:hypothetical protein